MPKIKKVNVLTACSNMYSEMLTVEQLDSDWHSYCNNIFPDFSVAVGGFFSLPSAGKSRPLQGPPQNGGQRLRFWRQRRAAALRWNCQDDLRGQTGFKSVHWDWLHAAPQLQLEHLWRLGRHPVWAVIQRQQGAVQVLLDEWRRSRPQ